MNGAIARIIIRYGVGLVAGLAYGEQLAADPDLVMALAALIGVATEGAYALAKRKGWTT
jgi:hypothetical protein